ncbi:adhesion G-protein coupled receptor G4 [Siniperca chuatsi]|uniref:adhesion G-protein coupled receptor G4 n=1 Tax=Siniperca chuatsi TaxID=119488 RepID=UPI001CE0E924|nr:adhesion G-protein coupled receptor G4 [Siniperca chuatsi]
MCGLCFEGQWRWRHHFLLVIWLSLLTAAPPKALGYFLGDTKAVLNGCEDHWTLQDRAAMPLLIQMTVCVDIRVVVPGAWLAFSYSSVYTPRPELGLEGDDEALYGWLLGVRHRFPIRLSPTHWHRVCLRRDVMRNSFSLEVDGKMVAERTVIAEAIPPFGSLRLGCRPRDRPPGAVLGQVELYLFRMWADLGDHGLCEDGTVIGWNAQYWGVTSAKARQRDPKLLCDHRRLRRGARAYRSSINVSTIATANGRSIPSPLEVPSTTTTSSTVIATPVTHTSSQTSKVTESPLVNCYISQLCSNESAYFWMSINVKTKGDSKTEQDVHKLVSNAFGCHGDSNDKAHEVTCFKDICKVDRQLQVNCSVKKNIRETTCDVLLQLSHAVSVCELQCAGVSALQQAGDEQIQATIIGEVERVGRDLCGDVEPSSGRFVRCTSTSSLDDICRANKHSNLTCSLIEPNSNPASQPKTESCNREVPRFCDCTAFCNSTSQFFAIRININSASVNVNLLKKLLSTLGAAGRCNTMSGSKCQDSEISKHYQDAHLECHGTIQRLYSCMVILEMSGPVSSCSLNKLLQQLIDSYTGITNERPLTRMVVCGPPGLPVRTLLASNLTWVASDLLTSDICQPDPTLLKCEANEKLAVLLTDSCPPTAKQSTTQPPTLTNSNITTAPEASPQSVTNTTEQTYMTAENTVAVQQTNASQGTAQPNITTPLTNINSTQSSTAQPVLQTSSHNMTVTVSDSTTVQNTTLSDNTSLLTPTENTKLQNTTTAHQNTTEFITVSSVNSTLQTTADLVDSTLYTNTLSSNHTTVYNVTTVDTFTPSPNDTAVYNVTTADTITPSINHTTVYNVTTADNNWNLHNSTITTSNTTISTFTTSPNHTIVYNETTVDAFTSNHTAEYNVTTVTLSPNPTRAYNVTTADNNWNLHNGTIATSNTTISTFTPSPNNATMYNVTTADTFTHSTNHTTAYNVTTANTFTPSTNHTTEYNVTTADNNWNLHNGTIATSNTTISTFTPSPNNATMDNVTTADTFTHSTNHTTAYNVTTANTFTPSTNHTTEDNVTTVTPSPNPTKVYNVTTVDAFTSNHTAEYNVTTVTLSPNPTRAYNVTTADNNWNLHNGTIATSNTTISTFTPSPNNATMYNVTTADTFTHSTNHTTAYNVTTANTFTPSTNHTTEYNVTTADNNWNLHNGTIATSNTTISTFTPSPNNATMYNVTTADTFTHSTNHTTAYNVTTANTFTPSTNHTTEYNVTTADNNWNLHNGTIATSNTTISTFTPSPNNATMYNVTTADTFTHSTNHTTAYNVTTANTFTPSTNHTTEYNITTVTPSPNPTKVYNVTTADNNRNLHNSTITTSNTTIGTFTTSPNHTIVYNVTTVDAFTSNHTAEYNVTTANTFTPSTNHTTEYNVTTVTHSPNNTVYNVNTTTKNYTTEYNVTTADNNTNLHNGTITSDATISPLTTSTSHTVLYNVTTVTPSPNNTTEYKVTTANNNRTLYNSSITSNATISTFTPSPNYNVTTADTFTPSPNHTAVYNVTTAANNYTTDYNVTTADSNRNVHNGTITTSNATISTFTPSPNYTMVNNVTTLSNNYTTVQNITTTTVSQNKTTDNRTTTPIREQNTTAPYKNTTMSTAARQDNETLNNATTSTKNSTVTSVVDNTTKPTVAPLNQTANHTAARVTHNITTTNKNDTNSTTAATGVSPIINLNETAGTSFNLSSTASSLTANFNLTTTGPGVSLTNRTTTSTHGSLPTQIDTTTAKVSLTSSTTTLQTTTLTSTITTKPGTGTTSTTTAETTKSQEAQEEQANELLDQTHDASQLNASQVAQLVGQLEKVLGGPTVSQAVGQKAINVISNLMGANSVALSASANRLIRLVDDLGLKLVVTGDREIISSNSLVLAVRTVDGSNFPTTSVNIFNTDNVQLHAFSRSRSKRSESALGSVFLPSSLTSGLSPEQQQQASRVQFTFYTKSALFQDAALDNQTLVSPVLGSSVANLSISNLSKNIQFTIRNINPINANYVASCAFWDFTQNGGGGGWSSAGCFVVNATVEDTTCSCNHLTSFAILLDLSREGITDHQQAQILTFITYIGCGISAVFLAVTLLTYLLFEKLLRDIPAKILVQLCISLLLLNLVFLLDGWLALYPAIGLCISTAFFLHYFLLTSFTWAGLEALHMYLSVVQVFTPYLSRYMLKFSLLGWGIPLMVVIIVISVDKDNYGLVTYGKYTDGTSDDFCWLRNDIAFYVGVVAYFILIFALCLLVFIMVMVQLARIKKQNPQNKAPNRGMMTDVRSIVGLVILLGLTWGFALFAWGPLYLPFVYLFSIFNTLQGFLVFVFHCAVKENVRRQWRTYLCCGRLRLPENSEWSRTATQNNRNLSVATATTAAPHFTSRSSSINSDGTNSSGSVFVDSRISDSSNSDVLLNEIHRQNLSL